MSFKPYSNIIAETSAEFANWIRDATRKRLDDMSDLDALKVASESAGDVVGPASATADAFAQFSGTTGKLLKDGVVAGTSAGNIVQLNGSAQLPAVSGALLTNLPGGGFIHPGYIAGKYYFGLGRSSNVATGPAVTANKLYLVPILIGASVTFTKIGVEVTTFAAGNVRLGIYNMTSGLPSTLIVDAGTASTGTNGIKEITISQALTAGVYCLAAVFDATPAMRVTGVLNNSAIYSEILGQDSNAAASGEYNWISRAFTYGALPSPYSGALTYEYGQPVNIWLRP